MTPAALSEAFPPTEARRVLRRLEFHYVPKHASWLNMVEIEIGALSAQCLDRRIPDISTLDHEVDAWTRARNAAGARVRWMFWHRASPRQAWSRVPGWCPQGGHRVNQSKSLR
jgi:hypothetical protein